MSKISTLPVKGLHSIHLSSHPLEGVHPGNITQAVELFVQEIKKKGIMTIVVLLPSHEIHDLYGDINLLELYRVNDLEVIHFPLENFSVPDKMELFHTSVQQIEERLKRCDVLIHCMAGCGRTGMMAAGILVKLGWPATDAIEAVRQCRPGSMDVLRQILFLRGYQRFLEINT